MPTQGAPAGTRQVFASWIVKQGNVRKTWKRRWLILEENGWLRYYKAAFDPKTDKKPKPAGQIHLFDEMASVKSHDEVVYDWPVNEVKNAFCVVTSTRTFYFVCDLQNQCTHWKACLHKWICDAKAKYAPASPSIKSAPVQSMARAAEPNPEPSVARAAAPNPESPSTTKPTRSLYNVVDESRRLDAVRITDNGVDGDYAEIGPDDDMESPSTDGPRILYDAVCIDESATSSRKKSIEQLYAVPTKKRTRPPAQESVNLKNYRAVPAPPDDSSDSDHDEEDLQSREAMYPPFSKFNKQHERSNDTQPLYENISQDTEAPPVPRKRDSGIIKPNPQYENVVFNQRK